MRRSPLRYALDESPAPWKDPRPDDSRSPAPNARRHTIRVLILGGTGTIGSALAAACDDRRFPHLTTSYRGNADGYSPLDVRDADAVTELIADYQPDTTVYAAPVDDPAGVSNVARAVRTHGGLLVGYSSAAVFGECSRSMREGEPTNPLDERAMAHAEMERALREVLPERHLIVRTSTVFGDAPGGLVARLLRRLGRGDEVRADTERQTMPTFATDLAEVTFDLLKYGHGGTFHAVGPDRHTDFTFARLVAHLFGYDADLVTPAVSEDDDRPKRVLLDRTRLRALLGTNALRPPADGLRAVRARLTPRPLAAAA